MWEKIERILELSFFGNSVKIYLIAFLVILAGLIFKRLLAKAIGFILYRVFRKQAASVGAKQLFQLTRKPLGSFLMLIFLFIACNLLTLPTEWNLAPVNEFGLRMVLLATFEILTLSCLIWLSLRIIDFIGLVLVARASKDENKMNDYIIPFAIDIIKIIVLVLGIFLILGSVFKLNIGSLIAGLGIGGLAIALAGKETIENLFGSFTIFLDKPFIIGDLIKIGEITGTVEKIGFRSTRIRTFEKSYVTIPNKKMIDAELDNLTMRTSMRVKTYFSLRFDTSTTTIQKIISGIEDHLKTHEQIETDYVVKLHDFGESAFQLFVSYYVLTGDWSEYMSVKEKINFEIIETVRKAGAEFARPSGSIRIENPA
jgi:MscS family membrane protein